MVKGIKITNKLCFNKINEIEKQIVEFDNETSVNFDFEKIKKNILKHLKFNERLYTDDDFNKIIDGTIKSILNNIYDGKYWNFAEIYIPIHISNEYQNLKWIYCTQLFACTSYSKPANFLDCIFLSDDFLLYCEIKSATNCNTIYNSTKDAQDQLITWSKNNDKQTILMSNIKNTMTLNDISTLEKVRKNYKKYLIGFFNVGFSDDRNKINVNDELENECLSFLEMRKNGR